MRNWHWRLCVRQISRAVTLNAIDMATVENVRWTGYREKVRNSMERLTVKWADKVYDTFDPVDIVDNEYSKANYNKILTKLGDYEDLEEQGRLIKLPCKVGDKIFLDFAGFGKDVDKFTVKDFHLDCFKDGETTLFCDYESNDRTLSGQIDVMEFGKTVFLTKSEAEAKLKELRGGENESSN